MSYEDHLTSEEVSALREKKCVLPKRHRPICIQSVEPWDAKTPKGRAQKREPFYFCSMCLTTFGNRKHNAARHTLKQHLQINPKRIADNSPIKIVVCNISVLHLNLEAGATYKVSRQVPRIMTIQQLHILDGLVATAMLDGVVQIPESGLDPEKLPDNNSNAVSKFVQQMQQPKHQVQDQQAMTFQPDNSGIQGQQQIAAPLFDVMEQNQDQQAMTFQPDNSGIQGQQQIAAPLFDVMEQNQDQQAMTFQPDNSGIQGQQQITPVFDLMEQSQDQQGTQATVQVQTVTLYSATTGKSHQVNDLMPEMPVIQNEEQQQQQQQVPAASNNENADLLQQAMMSADVPAPGTSSGNGGGISDSLLPSDADKELLQQLFLSSNSFNLLDCQAPPPSRVSDGNSPPTSLLNGTELNGLNDVLNDLQYLL